MVVGAGWLVVRSVLRRRWRSLLAVAVIVGVAGGLVLTALAGARRTESALPRLLDGTRNEDVSLEVSPPWFAAIETLPEVGASAPASFMFVSPDPGSFDVIVPLAGTDGRFGEAVNRPRLVAGRRPDPGRSDEVLANTEFARRFAVGAGDPLSLASMTPAQLDVLLSGGDPGPPAGPAIEVVVVGVGATAEELANDSAILLLTPAFFAEHRDDVAHFDDILMVRLRRGARDLPAFRAGLERVVPASEGLIVDTNAQTATEIGDATRVQAASLLIFAGAAALAGLLTVGQVLARQIATSGAEQAGLRALGLSRRARFASLVAPAVLVAVVGAGLAAAGAFAASGLLPTGFARRVEPANGLAADGLVLGLGGVTLAVVVSALAAMSAWSASARVEVGPAPATATSPAVDPDRPLGRLTGRRGRRRDGDAEGTGTDGRTRPARRSPAPSWASPAWWRR